MKKLTQRNRLIIHYFLFLFIFLIFGSNLVSAAKLTLPPKCKGPTFSINWEQDADIKETGYWVRAFVFMQKRKPTYQELINQRFQPSRHNHIHFSWPKEESEIQVELLYIQNGIVFQAPIARCKTL